MLVALLAALGAGSAHGTGPAPFEERLETNHAVILFHRDDRAHAQRVSESIDQAVPLVARKFGQPKGKVIVFLYPNDEDMARGLAEVLDYPQHAIDAVVTVGISARTRDTLHVHRKTARWDREVLLHNIVDEHTQGVTEARFGPRPAEHAAWLEEGLSSYVAYEALRDRLPAFEGWFDTWNRKEAFKALVSGRLPSLKDLSAREAWNRRITRDRQSWVAEYTFAHVAVSGLVDKYGLVALERILDGIAAGEEYPKALKGTLGVSLGEFEFRTKATLLLAGLTGFYAKYAATAAAIGTLFLAVVVSAFRARARRLRD